MSTTRNYVDIRDIHPDYERRACSCCGAEWYYQEGSANGYYCPICDCRPLLRELGVEYAEDYASYSEEDYNIKPEPFHVYIPLAMAYEASEELGFPVNEFRCLRFIDDALPESHRRHKPNPPETRKAPPYNVIESPDGLRTDGGHLASDLGPEAYPDPQDDPFACSICGAPLGESKRVEGEEHCDGCLRDAGILPYAEANFTKRENE